MSLNDHSPIDALPDILMDVPEMVFAFGAGGRYLFINHAAARFLGADPIEVIGYDWRELGYDAVVMEPLMELVRHVMETGETERHAMTSSAERGNRPIGLSLTPLRDEDGGVFAVLMIAHDLSQPEA